MFCEPPLLVNAALSYHTEKFNFSLNVYNITDVNYPPLEFSTPQQINAIYTQEPVNFRLSLGVNLVSHKR